MEAQRLRVGDTVASLTESDGSRSASASGWSASTSRRRTRCVSGPHGSRCGCTCRIWWPWTHAHPNPLDCRNGGRHQRGVARSGRGARHRSPPGEHRSRACSRSGPATIERRTAPFVVLERFHLAIAIVTVLASSVFLLALMVMLVEERRVDGRHPAPDRLRGGRASCQHVLAEGVVIALAGAVFGIVLSVLHAGRHQPVLPVALRHGAGVRAHHAGRGAAVDRRRRAARRRRHLRLVVVACSARDVSGADTTMSSALAFAARSLVRQPGRTALGILGIAAVGALLFDMLLLSRGLVVSFRDLLDSVGFDVRVTGDRLAAARRRADARMRPRRGARVAALPEVAEARSDANGDRRIVRAGRPHRPGPLTANGSGDAPPVDDRRRRDLPPRATPPAIVVNAGTARTPSARRPAASSRCARAAIAGRAAAAPRTFTLVGVAQFPFDDEAQNTAVVTPRRAAGRVRRRSRTRPTC